MSSFLLPIKGSVEECWSKYSLFCDCSLVIGFCFDSNIATIHVTGSAKTSLMDQNIIWRYD